MSAALSGFWIPALLAGSLAATYVLERIDPREEGETVDLWATLFGPIPAPLWPRLRWIARVLRWEITCHALVAWHGRDLRALASLVALLAGVPGFPLRIVVMALRDRVRRVCGGPSPAAAVGATLRRAGKRAAAYERAWTVGKAHAAAEAERIRARELAVVLGALYQVGPYDFPPECLN